MLTVGGMAFQDGWNIDLLRVRRCSIQILQKDGKRISLCSKYLSGCNGIKVFPGIG
jgi:Predicted Fe-S oxidoreductases